MRRSAYFSEGAPPQTLDNEIESEDDHVSPWRTQGHRTLIQGSKAVIQSAIHSKRDGNDSLSSAAQNAVETLMYLSQGGAIMRAVIGECGDCVRMVGEAICALVDSIGIVRSAWRVLEVLSKAGYSDAVKRSLETVRSAARLDDCTTANGSYLMASTTVECAICLDDAAIDEHEGRRLVRFHCGHAFCQACVLQHVEAKLSGKGKCNCASCSEASLPQCPLCRRPVDAMAILSFF